MIRLALFEPEIPHNTGALMRLCACLGVPLDLIEPLGFVLNDKHLKRSGMDYRDMAAVTRFENAQAFWDSRPASRVILLDTKGDTSLYDFQFQENDTLMMGKESTGVPTEVFNKCTTRLHIPMLPGFRSLNMALAASMTLGEALRQTRS